MTRPMPGSSKAFARKLAVGLLLGSIVIVFRLTAWLHPSPITGNVGVWAIPLHALGIWFLACSLMAWLWRPSVLTRTLLVYGVGQGIHWGGAIGAGQPAWEAVLLVGYAAATATADGAILDLASRYPRSMHRRAWRTAGFYLPAILAWFGVLAAPWLPGPALEAGLGIVFLAAFLMSIAAGIVFLAKWVRALGQERPGLRLTPVVAALVLSSVADLLAQTGALPGAPAAWQLIYAVVPAALAWTLIRGVR